MSLDLDYTSQLWKQQDHSSRRALESKYQLERRTDYTLESIINEKLKNGESIVKELEQMMELQVHGEEFDYIGAFIRYGNYTHFRLYMDAYHSIRQIPATGSALNTALEVSRERLLDVIGYYRLYSGRVYTRVYFIKEYLYINKVINDEVMGVLLTGASMSEMEELVATSSNFRKWSERK